MPNNDQPPPKIKPRVIGAPKIRQFCWCDFPQDAQLPEFWKRRPVIILSYRNTFHGAVRAGAAVMHGAEHVVRANPRE